MSHNKSVSCNFVLSTKDSPHSYRFKASWWGGKSHRLLALHNILWWTLSHTCYWRAHRNQFLFSTNTHQGWWMNCRRFGFFFGRERVNFRREHSVTPSCAHFPLTMLHWKLWARLRQQKVLQLNRLFVLINNEMNQYLKGRFIITSCFFLSELMNTVEDPPELVFAARLYWYVFETCPND